MRRPLHQTSLRRKLILVIMLTVGVALVLALGAFLAIEIRGFRASAQRELYILAEVMGEGSAAAIEFQDAKDAERLLATLRVQRRIVEAALLDRDGAVFATYRRDGKGAPALPVPRSADAFAFEGGHLWLTRPVRHAGETLGTIYLRADLVELNARIRWVLAGGFLLTLLIGSAAWLLAMRMGRVISEPILHLADAARRMAERQDPGERVVRETQDEVGVLVDAFNGLLDQLGERQARLEEAQHLAHLGSWSFDPAGRHFEWSEETFHIFGLEPVYGEPEWRTFRGLVHPDDRPAVEAAVKAAWRHRTPFSLDHRLCLGDGTVRWIHVSGAWFPRPGKPQILRGTVMDITERKQSEAALRQGQKLESLGVLAGGIAHDFNNLLAALQGNLDLAFRKLPAGSVVGVNLIKAERILQKAADLTRQMLAYSGKGQFQLKPLDLGQMVKEMGHLLSVSISKKAELRYELAEGLPVMVADPAQIHQVVMNLVINASDALKDREGFILLRTASVELDEADLRGPYAGQNLAPGPYVALEVEDNGHGMDAHTLDRIFDPFFTTKFTGRGLGLAAMLGIVKGHKGGIKVFSEPGRGTTFRLLFPASPGAALPERGPDAEDAESYRGTGTVLVVDDEPEIRASASAIFEHMGFHVLQAADGREGLAQVMENPGIRLVLLDLTMPHMDGTECLRAIREVDRDVPVLLSSGFSEHEITDALRDLGLAGFLQKPYSVADLMAKTREVLG